MQLIILEEHHEAYFVWLYAILNHLIPITGNSLIHIDQHADLELPVFNDSIKNKLDDLNEIINFTYHSLNIDNFIIPAIYQKLFDKVFWINHNCFKNNSGEYVVFSINQEGKIFSLKKATPQNREIEDAQSFFYQITTIHDKLQKIPKSLLNIDLDYFSCIKKPLPQGKIEITKNEYKKFQNNPYHFIRLYIGLFAETFKENNKYFIRFNNYNKQPKYNLEVSMEKVDERINNLKIFLKMNNITPNIITISRSRYSGFTPLDQWENIESRLLLVLRDIYVYDKNWQEKYISDIIMEIK